MQIKYPDDFINKVVNADCLEVMQYIPDNSIDLVLTDPPYGDNAGYGRKGKEIANNEDESINYKVIPILYNKLKDASTCYLFTNWKFYPLLHQYITERTEFVIRMMIVIVKNNIGMGYGFRNQHELCFVLEKGVAKYNGNDFSNVQHMAHVQHNDKSHPHEKGLVLIKKMLLHASVAGDVVLDCFLGSGTTAVACKQTNRKCIGIELSDINCQIALDRLSQGELF